MKLLFKLQYLLLIRVRQKLAVLTVDTLHQSTTKQPVKDGELLKAPVDVPWSVQPFLHTKLIAEL
jgi:hypothetical protein